MYLHQRHSSCRDEERRRQEAAAAERRRAEEVTAAARSAEERRRAVERERARQVLRNEAGLAAVPMKRPDRYLEYTMC